jgi:type IV secretory pathway VirB6-like protein
MYINPLRILIIALALFILAGIGEAYAQESCSSSELYDPICIADSGSPDGMSGLCVISKIVTNINQILDGASFRLFESIRNAGINTIFSALLTLYVVITGVMYMIGAIQASGWDLFIRMFKIALISAILSDGGMEFFEEYISNFFRFGTDYIICETSGAMTAALADVTMLSATGLPSAALDGTVCDYGTVSSSSVFRPLDLLIGQLISPRMLAVLTAVFTASPSGWGLGFMIIFAGSGIFLLGAIARGLWIYLMSLLVTAFLLGLAPMFFLFLLFDRTKQIFERWLDTIVSLSLQPIFVFAFFGLFASIMQVGIAQIMDMNVCISCDTQGSGNENMTCEWKFADSTGAAASADVTSCEMTPLGVQSGQEGDTGFCQQLNQIISQNFLNILIFLLLAYICWNFFSFALNLAQAISGSVVNLDGMTGILHNYIGQAGTGINRAIGGGIGSMLFPKPPAPPPTTLQ